MPTVLRLSLTSGISVVADVRATVSSCARETFNSVALAPARSHSKLRIDGGYWTEVLNRGQSQLREAVVAAQSAGVASARNGSTISTIDGFGSLAKGFFGPWLGSWSGYVSTT